LLRIFTTNELLKIWTFAFSFSKSSLTTLASSISSSILLKLNLICGFFIHTLELSNHEEEFGIFVLTLSLSIPLSFSNLSIKLQPEEEASLSFSPKMIIGKGEFGLLSRTKITSFPLPDTGNCLEIKPPSLMTRRDSKTQKFCGKMRLKENLPFESNRIGLAVENKDLAKA